MWTCLTINLAVRLMCILMCCFVFFFKQKTAYEMRISDWSSDVCSSDLQGKAFADHAGRTVEFADDAPVRGAIAGFLLKLALGRDPYSVPDRAVAAETSGQLEAGDFQRNAILVDQNDFAREVPDAHLEDQRD